MSLYNSERATVVATGVGLWLALALALAGCTKSPPVDPGLDTGTQTGNQSNAGTGATNTAGAPSSTATAGASGVAKAGSAAPSTAGSAAAGSGGSTSSAGASAAGSGGTTAAGSAAAGSGGASGGAAPSGPADPDKLGPYEVKLDQPVGEGFGVPIASSDTGDGISGCKSFAEGFGGDPDETAKLIKLEPDLRMDLYSLYRPAQLEEGKTYPVITWGNGTCAKPEGYGPLLRHMASHGFFVIAANSRQVGQNSPMTKALDWAEAANKDSKSPYFGKFDLEHIGAMGHSQGGTATVAAARDKRVKVVIIWNGGTTATKPFLAVSGERDIPMGGIASFKRDTNAAPKAAWLWYHNVPGMGSLDGHLTLMVEPERVVGPAAAWFRYVLMGDQSVKSWLVGADCKLCTAKMDDLEYGQKGL